MLCVYADWTATRSYLTAVISGFCPLSNISPSHYAIVNVAVVAVAV